MKILVAGAGKTGASIIEQLRKNKSINIVVLDPRENPFAIEEGIIDKIDITEALTPLTLEFVMKKVKPDLILLTAEQEDLGLGNAPGMDALSNALREELASICDIPVIQVARVKGK